MPKVEPARSVIFLLSPVPKEPQFHIVAQGERPAAAVLKQLIPKAAKGMGCNHLLNLQVLYLSGAVQFKTMQPLLFRHPF
jgi:hypothetical protein